MADITNLTQFLSDVASAIRTKRDLVDAIPAKDFDTQILQIETGMDTSDATATINDVIAPKTFYNNGEKLTGNIIERVQPLEPSLKTASYLIATGNVQSHINDNGIAIAKSGTTLKVYHMKNDGYEQLGAVDYAFTTSGNICDITDCFYDGDNWKILIAYNPVTISTTSSVSWTDANYFKIKELSYNALTNSFNIIDIYTMTSDDVSVASNLNNRRL